MAFDFKTATPEAAIVDANLLFGALSFAEPNPSVFPVSTLRNLLLGGGSLAITAGKTLTVTETMTLTALGSSQTYTFPAAGGTEILSASVPGRELLFMEDQMLHSTGMGLELGQQKFIG